MIVRHMDWSERNKIFRHLGPRPIKVKFLLITFIKRINFKSRQASLWRTGSSVYNLSLRAPVRMCPNHDPIGRCQEPQPMGRSNTRGPQYLDFFKSVNSNWLRIQNKFSVLTCYSGRLEFLVLIKRISASGGWEWIWLVMQIIKSYILMN